MRAVASYCSLSRKRRIVIRWGFAVNASKLSPLRSIVSLTRWDARTLPACVKPVDGVASGSEDTDEVIPADTYNFVSRDRGQAVSASPTRDGPNHNDPFLHSRWTTHAGGKSRPNQHPARATR